MQRQPNSSQSTRHLSTGQIALASAIGCTIEWYDFFLYGVVTALVFNRLFFPSFDPLVGMMLAYTTFAVGFVARPIGGVLFGHYGDRIGRKRVLVLTLLIMGVATFLIGLLPTYQTMGFGAAALLLLLRVFQGIGIGGEWGGAVLMAVEHSPSHRRGFYGSWPQIGVPAGLMLSAGVVAVLSRLPDAQFVAWGWRAAFLLSGVLVAIGLYIRLKVMETPEFLQLQQAGGVARVPFVDMVRSHLPNTLLGLGARYVEGVCFNTFGVFIVSYLTSSLHLPRSTALLGVVIASGIMIVMLPVYGILSDRIGRRPIYCAGALAIGLTTFPAFWVMSHAAAGGDRWPVWLAIVVPFAFAYPAVYGPQAALFCELFHPRVRYTGVSFVYQFSGIFASGLTPLIATALLSWGDGQPWLICGYVAVVAVISFASVLATARLRPLDAPVPEAAPEMAAKPSVGTAR